MLRGREDFQDLDPRAFKDHAIRECPARIHTDAHKSFPPGTHKTAHSIGTSRKGNEVFRPPPAKRHELLGEDGFEEMVETVAGIEKALGIYDLAKFTPAPAGAK